MPKVLYLILAHGNPEQLLRLVKALRTGSSRSPILIHYDFHHSRYPFDPEVFERFENARVLRDPVAVEWGGFSLVEAILHGMERAIAGGPDFDWVSVLSAQDYPIQPIDRIERFLQDTDRDGFLEYFRADDPPEIPSEFGLRWLKKTGIERYYYQYRPLPSTTPRILKRLFFHLDRLTEWQPFFRFPIARGEVFYGTRSPRPPFDRTFQCYAGSSWFTISRECVLYLLEFARKNPDLAEYYRRTLHSDESFFQTVLINSRKFNIVNDNLRFIPWNRASSSHPSILQIQDLDRLLASGKHFARKFDLAVDEQILDALDRELASDRIVSEI
ncbi:beta-1,6-N-acetylglucosaminyltransferase [Pannus brasiliensis CCIBt3594]|uniref:Peptide O-xylosyltransferase n=1 Tax=Pannus brasiliensis CCIBt3594 TaxID=1427578 RepID=A0AAW9QRJ1_9CHRO